MKRWVGPLLLVIVFFFCLLGNLPVSCQHPAYSRSHLEVDLQDYFPIAPANGYQMAMLWSGGYITVTGRKYSIAGEDGIVACEIQAGDLRSNAYFLVRSTGIYMARNRGDLKESRECLFLPGRAEPGQHWNSTIDGEAFEATFLAKISEFSKVPGDYVVVKFVRLQ